MNFGQFTSKLKASAASAADAARSFQGLDAMAANDAYIHSESLNVRGRSQSNISPADNSALSSHRRTATSASMDNCPRETGESEVSTYSRPSTQSVQSKFLPHDGQQASLLSVVQETLSHHSRSDRHEASDSALGASDEDDESEDDDPILSLIRSETHSSSSKQSLDQKSPGTRRFLDDLEKRISVPIETLPHQAYKNESASAGWLSSLRLNTSTSTASPLVAAPWSRSRAPKTQQREDQEIFEVVTATAMLGSDEMNELAQLKQKSATNPSVPTLVWFLIKEHPRESFIVFTLLLGAFAYFRTRGDALEDNVHRT
jgi:hypothetical protein